MSCRLKIIASEVKFLSIDDKRKQHAKLSDLLLAYTTAVLFPPQIIIFLCL